MDNDASTTTTKPKRVRKHKSSGTQWTAEQHRQAGHAHLSTWLNADTKRRIDALKDSLGVAIPEVLERALTALERELAGGS